MKTVFTTEINNLLKIFGVNRYEVVTREREAEYDQCAD